MATTSGINTSGITVGNDGKIKVSGLGSSIDWQSMVEATMKAKRIPAVRLENSIATNSAKVSAYGELKSLSTDLTKQLDLLRGNPAFGAADIFKTRAGTGTTSSAAGAPVGHVPSSIDALVLASVGNNAVNGNYQMTVHQLAQAQQIRSDMQNSTNTALGLTGNLEINGKQIAVNSSSTLLDVRASINSAGAGVTATIVSASPTEHYLVVTSDKTGTDSAIDFGADQTLADTLGLTAGGVVKTQLQEAKNAIIDINGVTGIERQTNEVADVVEGVTLRLQKAEPNTVINLKIATDLNAVKTTVVDFVNAYNALKSHIIEQRTAMDRNEDGVVDGDEFGELYGESVLRQIEGQLSGLVNTEVGSNPEGFRSLSQMGITIDANYNLAIDESVLDNRLLTNPDAVKKLFGLNVSTSDGRMQLVNRGSATVAGTYYVSVAGTDASGNITAASISSTPGGPSIGTVSVTGGVLSVNDGPAAGLKMLFSGGANAAAVNDIQVTVSRGMADQFHDFFKGVTDSATGMLDREITSLQTQNTDYEARVDLIDTRLEVTRALLINKYTRMETALAQLESLRKTIESYSESMNAG